VELIVAITVHSRESSGVVQTKGFIFSSNYLRTQIMITAAFVYIAEVSDVLIVLCRVTVPAPEENLVDEV
jgi:hypothetical protein